MALEGQPHLHNPPAQQDQTHGPDQPEDEIGQVVDHRQRVAGGKGRHGVQEQKGQNRHGGAIAAIAPPDLAFQQGIVGDGLGILLSFGSLGKQIFHGVYPPLDEMKKSLYLLIG